MKTLLCLPYSLLIMGSALPLMRIGIETCHGTLWLTPMGLTLFFFFSEQGKIIPDFHIINKKSGYLTPVYSCIWVVAELPIKAFHILTLHFWTKKFLYHLVKLVIIHCICIVTKHKNIVRKFKGLYCIFSCFFYFLIYFLVVWFSC